MVLLRAENLTRDFDRTAVNGVSLTLSKGEILCLLGPSGCGKTTLLRLISGLETPDQGSVILEGKEITQMPPHLRNFGLMFQDFALFPHKSVYANVAFGLEMQRQPEAQIRPRVMAMLEMVGLADLCERNVAELSGGERQRVALARSLAPRPQLLMLDEPLGALDRSLRERLLIEIRDILKRLETTAIFVTHDQSEALAVADRVAVMNKGQLIQVDTPETLYRHPASVFVARFLGFDNLLDGKMTDASKVDTPLGSLSPAILPSQVRPGDPVTVVLRPEGACLAKGSDTADGGRHHINGRVLSRLFCGSYYRVAVAFDRSPDLTVHIPGESVPPAPGEAVALTLKPSAVTVIPKAAPSEETP